ncbi:MAG TPA: hydantoinase/oxoprolinase family protein [bacterium]|nr:hydantoinase/oxoprolinase family protein [bacterium]
MALRMGVDIGGTFTDLLLVDDRTGSVTIEKGLTTYPDPAEGVMAVVAQAMDRVDASPADVEVLVHGTTLAINTLIERTGSRTALFATQGHRDAIEIRREQRYDMYDVLLEAPKPLAPRHLRFDIEERVTADGRVAALLNREQVAQLLRRLQERGIEALAVCLLHSYRNPAHEAAIAEIAKDTAPALRVSLSSRVAPEIKEYERASTTLCNAYVQARVDGYLERLERDLGRAGFRGAFYLMQSSGGLLSTATAREFPVRILESGPAGGALAAANAGRVARRDRLLSFDMGGTTAKLAVINNGEPMVAPGFEVARVYRFARGSGFPVRIPVIEMIEIGAGGGSIARVDRLGLIRVGPESAGAHPGPACYGRGGEQPTVTDADLLLGYLDPAYFLGGQMPLDADAARRAIGDQVARPLGLDPVRAAWGTHRIVNENMANAAHVHLVERGTDPRAYAVFAFGGAGPVHAYGVASLLGAPSIVVPAGAGVASAVGFLTAPPAFEFVHGWYARLPDVDWARVNESLGDMETRGRALLRNAGVASAAIEVDRACDLRYEGQGSEVTVAVPGGVLSAGGVDSIRGAFEERYRALYGRTVPGSELEIVNWRVTVRGPRPALRIAPAVPDGQAPRDARKGSRPAYFDDGHGFVDTPVYDRYRLAPGAAVEGPAIIEERESTIIVGPGGQAEVDEFLNVIVTLPARRQDPDAVGQSAGARR